MFERIAAALPRRIRRADEGLGQQARGEPAHRPAAQEPELSAPAREPQGEKTAQKTVRLRIPAIFVVQDGAIGGDN